MKLVRYCKTYFEGQVILHIKFLAKFFLKKIKQKFIWLEDISNMM